jgi:hypothetical protein
VREREMVEEVREEVVDEAVWDQKEKKEKRAVAKSLLNVRFLNCWLHFGRTSSSVWRCYPNEQR